MMMKIPRPLYQSIQSAAHVALSMAFTTRGMTVPSEETAEEAAAVASAVESIVGDALNKARFAEIDSFNIYEDCPFTDNELRAVGLWAQGLSRSEIAESLGISGSAVNTRLENAAKRIPGCRNQRHGVVIAIRAGWV